VKIVKKIVVFLIIAFVGIQFVSTKRNKSSEVLNTDFSKIFVVPKSLQNTLKTSCYDCHSNNTNYPWYNKIQPISWLLENHIEEGKAVLNFSEFGTYSKRKQKNKLKSIVSQIEDNKMPLQSYTLIHNNAKLYEVQKNEFIQWFSKLKESL
jgi:hypothetical protein